MCKAWVLLKVDKRTDHAFGEKHSRDRRGHDPALLFGQKKANRLTFEILVKIKTPGEMKALGNVAKNPWNGCCKCHKSNKTLRYFIHFSSQL